MASLAGTGTCGNWKVDIDHEDEASCDWSIDIQSSSCAMQSMVERLTTLKEVIAMIRAVDSEGVSIDLYRTSELISSIRITGGRLILQIRTVQVNGKNNYPWRLEHAIDSKEAINLAAALEEALLEAVTLD